MGVFFLPRCNGAKCVVPIATDSVITERGHRRPVTVWGLFGNLLLFRIAFLGFVWCSINICKSVMFKSFHISSDISILSIDTNLDSTLSDILTIIFITKYVSCV